MTINTIITSIQGHLENLICGLKDYRVPKSQDLNHFVIFESDDWGSIRMPKYDGWRKLLNLGYAVDSRPYEKYDTLESKEDLEALFDVLTKHKDVLGHHPIITANMLVANPDFERIKNSKYSEYYYEPIEDTYNKYFGSSDVIDIMRQGLEYGIFFPQSHGREHFNVYKWLEGLQNGDKDLITAFQYNICGIAPLNNPAAGNQLMKALKFDNNKQRCLIENIVYDGLNMFENLWGFKSRTFVAPCYCWDKSLENLLVKNGVQLIQTARATKFSQDSSYRHFYTGQVDKNGLKYSVRNCFFEPSTCKLGSSAEDLMCQIDKVFAQRKIAIISTHRVNYVSGIDLGNRINNLKLLDDFLKMLLHKYPNTVFISSDKLIDIV